MFKRTFTIKANLVDKLIILMRDVNFLNLSKSTKINFIQVHHLDVIPKSRDIFSKNVETST